MKINKRDARGKERVHSQDASENGEMRARTGYAKENKQYSKFHIWQYTSHPIYLYSLEFIKQKINYIHQNPIRAGYVFEAEHYKYSSANKESPLKTNEI